VQQRHEKDGKPERHASAGFGLTVAGYARLCSGRKHDTAAEMCTAAEDTGLTEMPCREKVRGVQALGLANSRARARIEVGRAKNSTNRK